MPSCERPRSDIGLLFHPSPDNGNGYFFCSGWVSCSASFWELLFADASTSERERNLAKENGATQQANIKDENMQDLDDQQPS
ncbi:hypothetical protein TNCV_3328921 [Trichonephila clavipes]|nr:hypothetical protein TNCV_3328921 [Trichonephila clavipes]